MPQRLRLGERKTKQETPLNQRAHLRDQPFSTDDTDRARDSHMDKKKGFYRSLSTLRKREKSRKREAAAASSLEEEEKDRGLRSEEKARTTLE